MSKGLKALEKYKRGFITKEYEIIEKELKALEIIIVKNVNIKALKVWNKTYMGKLTYQNYLDILKDCDLGEKLNEEEFDLLTEVLNKK